jgi:carbonic anhydrase/acetyltransferase-like protein (isoleucine patch superfamily)
VGALSFIKEGEKIPPRSLVAGNPSKIIKQVSDEMLSWKTEGTRLYQELATTMQTNWKQTDAIHDKIPETNLSETFYTPFKSKNK